MSRLYEYWVFLQVLEACRQQYGTPVELGFALLGRRTRAGTTRLEIPTGATVSFKGEVHVAFEPHITSSGSGWQGLENVPHPNPDMAQHLITPDVVVLRLAPRQLRWYSTPSTSAGIGWNAKQPRFTPATPASAGRASPSFARSSPLTPTTASIMCGLATALCLWFPEIQLT